MTRQSPLNYSPEVRAALDGRAPVVAFESTIITHGMPYPQNLETAHVDETEVRKSGATQATIAVLSGRIHNGLTTEPLHTVCGGNHRAGAQQRAPGRGH
jgi:pseudouridylate synthase